MDSTYLPLSLYLSLSESIAFTASCDDGQVTHILIPRQFIYFYCGGPFFFLIFYSLVFYKLFQHEPNRSKCTFTFKTIERQVINS